MNDVLNFQRARKPEEQQLRREAILAAAAKLFDAEGAQGAGLNAIAAAAGFTKSNVYRYFESREEVLMSLFLSELELFALDFETGAAKVTPGDIKSLARCAADCFITHPRFCKLMPMLSSVLEQNVSEAKIIELKRAVSAINVRLASAMQARMPGSTLEDCAWVTATAATLVAGLWPNVEPSSSAAKVLAMPEFQHLKTVPERDLSRAIEALLVSIARA